MTFLAFLLILVSLLSFVVAQLVLKWGMEISRRTPLRHPRIIWLVTVGVVLMTISFFITLGLLQRFDLSYLYPFQGLSVIIIAVLAAVTLKEKVTLQLTVGTMLIAAGILLVSLS
jgi:drug/metabolite transporter (DMT)-like permease